jgi:glutamate N-acetyltransferase / amino-acid N-acetyltransferase
MNVRGFRFSAVQAGIKKRGGLDLALLVADRPVSTGAVFTRNIIRAAPVVLSEQRVLAGPIRAIVVNSGNANAFTGDAGMDAALRSTAAIARALGCPETQVVSCSTGVIGQVLPADKVEAAASALTAGLNPNGLETFADAILTTDRFRKVSEYHLERGGKQVHFAGTCKGAGMIHPDLGGAGKLPRASGPPHATMLAFLVTDAVASPALLQSCLERATDSTFNAVSVDGDTSTNDTVLVMASGESGVELDAQTLTAALVEICRPLARAMVQDGEGAEHVIDIRVTGLGSDAEAREIAKTIATSPLVKTAFAGKDANWGRLIAAAGRAGVSFDASRATISIAGYKLFDQGVPRPELDPLACEKMRGPAYEVELVLGDGPGTFTYTTCDLGHTYIDINAGYRS